MISYINHMMDSYKGNILETISDANQRILFNYETGRHKIIYVINDIASMRSWVMQINLELAMIQEFIYLFCLDL